ncbi:TylF/MycF family methyltransferase [Actinomadura sp. 7K534]|uniref:TylF/MycF family methyltransferase n=1 Tax=Actinomadura sp. 7K534 TaxID=2530366 RepID=UPI00104F349C|nr:TylF/MycF family methyltransferase [Actinomadura sp. 7K534]TDB98873.1 macrocin O-methyltransferase [Actinomadura sp. 7K534]
MDSQSDGAAGLYVDLLKKILVNVIYEDPPLPNPVFTRTEFSRGARERGHDWPSVAHTMVGMARLDNVQMCLETVLAEDVPGDFIETGAWRGGVCILARGIFKAHGADRNVWVADSFEGIPPVADGGHPDDVRLAMHEHNGVLAVDEATVKDNFARYGLLDDQVKFLAGLFRDTLPTAPIERLAVLRLDGDLYESTTDALGALYPKLSPGGFVIVDDYLLPGCRDAVDDFRRTHGIEGDELRQIDRFSVYWRRGR